MAVHSVLLLARQTLSCGQTRRTFASNALRLARFTRESIKARLHEPNVKKPQFEAPQPDLLPVRPLKDLWKCLNFTLVVGSSVFTAAAILEYERFRATAKRIFTDNVMTIFEDFRQHHQRSHLSDGQKTAFAIIAMNTVVYLLWQVPAARAKMWQYFTNSYASKSLCSPMLLSIFSHSSLIHFGLNMFVLQNFASVSVDRFIGPAQFIALYATSGVFSSFTSLAHKAVIRSPIRALGASGAILGVLCYTCMKMPESRLSIIFLPQWTFSAQNAVYGLLIFDFLGLLGGFRLFDHAAHLGGAIFGILYALYGEDFVRRWFNPFIVNYYCKLIYSGRHE